MPHESRHNIMPFVDDEDVPYAKRNIAASAVCTKMVLDSELNPNGCVRCALCGRRYGTSLYASMHSMSFNIVVGPLYISMCFRSFATMLLVCFNFNVTNIDYCVTTVDEV